ncbi:hypothetical protein [Nitrosovibrio sp. Nv17]|jgi:hypothetical protein|uniref:hypothetical protein n=1 Tax=Nitrosovibrio sp. Nv17 TaxID=1855339 RepID=UPI000908B174|nr:hypothetical protein [Nitrosovibrio sp. Nv17]SFW17493.1 hypothetical protein SAMN05216414_10432 [Nitrosovibrio sp. Nv17]
MMKKLSAIIGAIMLTLGSMSAMAAGGEVDPNRKPDASPREILNRMACKDKKAGEIVRDQSTNGKHVCPEIKDDDEDENEH